MRPLTPAQLSILSLYDAHDCAAMKYMGRFIWASEIRSDHELAERVYEDRREQIAEGL